MKECHYGGRRKISYFTPLHETAKAGEEGLSVGARGMRTEL